MSKFGTLKSMTGFGRASLTHPTGRFEVEIQGVNRRHLEISFSLPKSFFRFEQELRKLVSEWASRGQINIYVSWRASGGESVTVVPNIPLAKALKEGWEKIGKELKLDDKITFSLLAKEDVLVWEKKLEGEEDLLKSLSQVCVEALSVFDKARRQEGEALERDLLNRNFLLQKNISKIENFGSDAVEKMRKKLSSRLEELFSGQKENEEKVLKEVALFAEKIDITEEIIRFKNHAQALEETLKRPLASNSDAKGKRLEFLLQEMLREINTIGSKSNHTEISELVVDVKCELERMRESVQNIE